MEILITGNSQLGPLKTAYDADAGAIGALCKVSFLATSGGSGPYLNIEGDHLVPIESDTRAKAFYVPADTLQRPLQAFDAIVISALGYIDGYKSELPTVGRVRLSTFEPTGNESAPFVSEPCFRELIVSTLGGQPGVRFLHALREKYAGRIIVQPFPYNAASVVGSPDWRLATRHRNAIGYYKLLCGIRDEYLEQTCRDLGVTLLDYPYPGLKEQMFTPDHLINPADGIHPNREYGAAVLRQIGRVMEQAPATQGAMTGA